MTSDPKRFLEPEGGLLIRDMWEEKTSHSQHDIPSLIYRIVYLQYVGGLINVDVVEHRKDGWIKASPKCLSNAPPVSRLWIICPDCCQ